MDKDEIEILTILAIDELVFQPILISHSRLLPSTVVG
jgi:hypothetical protein